MMIGYGNRIRSLAKISKTLKRFNESRNVQGRPKSERTRTSEEHFFRSHVGWGRKPEKFYITVAFKS